jgi:hypothetical protein
MRPGIHGLEPPLTGGYERPGTVASRDSSPSWKGCELPWGGAGLGLRPERDQTRSELLGRKKVKGGARLATLRRSGPRSTLRFMLRVSEATSLVVTVAPASGGAYPSSGAFGAEGRTSVSTALTTFQKEDLVSAEVLADQISQKLEEAFKSLVTARSLIETLERLVDGAPIDYRSPEHEAELKEGLKSLRSVMDLDVWELDHASSGAASVKGVLGAARFVRENRDET